MTLNSLLEQIGSFMTSEGTAGAVSSTRGVVEQILFSPKLHEFLFPLKLVMFFWSALFFLSILYFLKTSKRFEIMYWSDFREFLMFKPSSVVQNGANWKKIMRKLDSPLEPEWKLAILEGFEMFEECLDENSGIDGFEEMTKSLSDKIGSVYEDILQDYQIRKKIIEKPSFEINKEQAILIMNNLEKGLKGLKWL